MQLSLHATNSFCPSASVVLDVDDNPSCDDKVSDLLDDSIRV
jgi:hypothetical protein